MSVLHQFAALWAMGIMGTKFFIIIIIVVPRKTVLNTTWEHNLNPLAYICKKQKKNNMIMYKQAQVYKYHTNEMRST